MFVYLLGIAMTMKTRTKGNKPAKHNALDNSGVEQLTTVMRGEVMLIAGARRKKVAAARPALTTEVDHFIAEPEIFWDNSSQSIEI
jgi:hypothetical protein